MPFEMDTPDELTEKMTLIQTKKIKNFLFLLVGKEYLNGLLYWKSSFLLKETKIDPNNFEFNFYNKYKRRGSGMASKILGVGIFQTKLSNLKS